MMRQEFLSKVATRAGLDSAEQAAPAAEAVLEVLAQRLSKLEAEALADDLPPSLAEHLRGPVHGQEFGLHDFYTRVGAREGVRPGFAVEHTVVVMQALAELLGGAKSARLKLELPAAIGALLTPSERIEPPSTVHLNRAHRTLAEGRPGSAHPLYEARPDRAQSESVARASNPHGETKLSSARGLTQERERETLADGRAGSSRPLHDAK